MRILLWYWGRRGGGAQYALGLTQALARRGDVRLRLSLSNAVELLPKFRSTGLPLSSIETYQDRLGFLASLPRIPRARQQLLSAAEGCDVVISAMTHIWTPLIAPQLMRAGIPYVPVVHDAVPHPGDTAFAWGWRLGRELRAARAAVALSATVEAALAARAPDLPLIRSRLPAFLAGVPTERHGEASGDVRFLFFGRLRAYKGLDMLRDAFVRLRKRHPGVRLRVVGQGNAEHCAPGLTAMPGVTVETRWVPESEVPHLLATADAVVLPYREASQSGVVPQALAMGVPVIATPVGGLTEQVLEGRGGMLAAAPTAAALAEAMAGVLAPGALARLREEARREGESATDWDAAAEEIVSGIARIL